MEKIAELSIILQQVFMISSSPISTSPPEISVKWKVITAPVVFGESVTLECKINVQHKWSGLEKYHFEWTGGKGKKILCRDGSKCIDENKYNMTTDQREKKSRLEILEFMEYDLDNEYTCSFQYQTYSEMLTLALLELNIIIKPPINHASLESVFIEDGFLFVTMTMENVYPKPICFVNFMYWPKNAFPEQLLNVSTSQNGSFLNAYLEGQFKVPGDICKGKSVISCDFGPKKYPVSIVEIDNCTSQANNENIMSDVESSASKYALAIGLPVFLTLVNIIGVYAFVHFKIKRQRPDVEEYTSITTTVTTTTETFRRQGNQTNKRTPRNIPHYKEIGFND